MQRQRANDLARRSEPGRARIVQRRAEPASQRPTVDDLSLSLDASDVQLDAFDGAVASVWDAVIQYQTDKSRARHKSAAIQRAAAQGAAGRGGTLPHLAAIQASFGPDHDLSTIQAHTGGAASDACADMHANAYATGDHVVFGHAPSLALAAHEAAHVVQQRGGQVQLSGGVGQVGDRWEQHADAVAARVVAGQSAADLLGPRGAAAGRGVQRQVQRDEQAAAPATAEAGKAGDGAKKEQSHDKAGVEQSLEVGDFTIAVKAGSDGGEGSIKGETKKDLEVPLFAGVFAKLAAGVTLSGKVAVKADGSFEGSVGAEIKTQIDLRGGVPKIASVFGGFNAKATVNALKIKKPAGGSVQLDRTAVSIKVAAVIGAELDALALLETVAPDVAKTIGAKTKVEWNPGGEIELLKLTFGEDGMLHFERGADLDRFEQWLLGAGIRITSYIAENPGIKAIDGLVSKLNDVLAGRAAGARDTRFAGKTLADSIIEPPIDDTPLPFPQ